MENNNIATSSTPFGVMNYLKNDVFIAPQALDHNVMYEQDCVTRVLTPYIEKAKYILDIGAHIGCHSVMYGKINPNAEIHSFEPQVPLYKLLKHNIQQNNINSKTYNCAVGNAIQMVTLGNTIKSDPHPDQVYQYDTEEKFNFGGVSLGQGGQDCMMITVDALDLPACDFIKIDVEGFEYFAILGAVKTITRYKPVIFYEDTGHSPDEYMRQISWSDQPFNQTVEGLLRHLGYSQFERHGLNILARPRGDKVLP